MPGRQLSWGAIVRGTIVLEPFLYINEMFFKNSKPLWKHVFSNTIFFVFISSLYKARTKSQITLFSISVFFHRHWRFTGQQEQGGDHLLFHSTTFTRSKTFRIYLPRCMWDDYYVFLIAPLETTKTATTWDLPPCWITMWLIDNAMVISAC